MIDSATLTGSCFDPSVYPEEDDFCIDSTGDFDLTEEDTIDPNDIAYAAYQEGLNKRIDAAMEIDFGVEAAMVQQLVTRLETLAKEIDECLPLVRSLLEGADS